MRCDDAEVRLVLAATLLLVALPTCLLLGPPVLALALLAPLVLVSSRLRAHLGRPDPWTAFERELDDLGVTVAEPPARATPAASARPQAPRRDRLPLARRSGPRHVGR